MIQLRQLLVAFLLFIPAWVGATEPGLILTPAPVVTIVTQKDAAATVLPGAPNLDRLAKGDKHLEWYETEVRRPSEIRDRVKAATSVARRQQPGGAAPRGATRSSMGGGRWGAR